MNETPRDVELVEEFAQRRQAGDCISIDEFVSLHTQYADSLRKLLPLIVALDALGQEESQDASGSFPPTPEPAIAPATALGDFRIIRELGRGGMGTVYEAEQISLGRRVALKLFPFAEALNEQHLQRFRNESRAAATLHHPNIVPIYSVGFDQGVHFFAMQLIKGPSLAQIISSLRAKQNRGTPIAEGTLHQRGRSPSQEPCTSPAAETLAVTDPTAVETVAEALSTQDDASGSTFFTRVADLGRQAAEALDHAHTRGVLHRDVKPGNLLLDEQGKLWLTDFGLARLAAQAPLTRSGDMIGTLRYMPPEQALGKRQLIDERADIYSLGLTLYELLTLKPAISGEDRPELLRNIEAGEIPPLRHWRPQLPRDLETIVLKCIDPDPVNRYTTAAELAADLRRFSGGEPIQARRPTLCQLAMRSLRKHSAAWTFGLVTIVLLLGVFGFMQRKQAAESQLGLMREQRLHAQSRRTLQLALTAIDAMTAPLIMAGETTEYGKLRASTAVQHYLAIATECRTRPEFLAETVHAFITIGELQQLLANPRKAEEAYRAAVAAVREVRGAVPAEQQLALAEATSALGQFLIEAERFDEAEPLVRESVTLPAQSPLDRLARSLLLHELLVRTQREDEAQQLLNELDDPRTSVTPRGLLQKDVLVPPVVVGEIVAQARHSLAEGNAASARRMLEQATFHEFHLLANPEDDDARVLLREIYELLTTCCQQLNDLPAAAKMGRRVEQLNDQLAGGD